MSEKNTKIIFYGALWGSVEATLGYLMHLLFLPFTGFLMFPIGAYFMRRGIIETEDRHSAIYIALMAGLIKCVDFFMPNIMPIKVINPVIAIILQGIAVSVFLAVYEKNQLGKALSVSVVWRLVFIAIVLIESLSGTPMRLLESGPIGISRYLLLDSLANGLLIYAMIKVLPSRQVKIRPSFAVVAFLAALSLNVML